MRMCECCSFYPSSCVCTNRKATLQEYASITSLVQEEMVAVHQAMVRAIDRIQPATNYEEFLPTCRYCLLRACLLAGQENEESVAFHSQAGWGLSLQV